MRLSTTKFSKILSVRKSYEMPHRKYFNFNKKIEEASTWNDRWVAELVLPEKTGGFFIEAGACGGIGGSCTYYFEKNLGWKGLLFEPTDNWFKVLLKNRPNSYCINKCLSSTDEEVKFLHFTTQVGRSTTYNFRGQHHDKLMESLPYEVIRRPSITLEDALIECVAPKQIDYMALDLNGSEYDVLSVFPFDKYHFKAISVEDCKCDTLLQDSGYIKVSNPFTQAKFENYFVHPSISADALDRIARIAP